MQNIQDEGIRFIQEVRSECKKSSEQEESKREIQDVEDMFPFVFKTCGKRNAMFPFVHSTQSNKWKNQKPVRRKLKASKMAKAISQSSMHISEHIRVVQNPTNTLQSLKRQKYKILFPEQSGNQLEQGQQE
jgi:hypothetical protein